MARLGVKLVAAAIVTGAVAVAAVLALRAPRMESASISEPWDELGGILWLKPNLRDALMVAPDRPHSPQEVERARAGGASIGRTRTFRVNTNAQRLRGREDVGPKRAGVTRILGIGESIGFGWGVADDETWHRQLEAMLEERGHEVEILNAGMPSAGSDTMAAFCRQIAPSLEPDIVVLVRRPPRQGAAQVSQMISQCERATGATAFQVLPPVSSFDLRGQLDVRRSAQHFRQLVESGAVVDLNPVFEAAREGRGETLVARAGELHVVDQETGETWLSVPEPAKGGDIPAAVGQLFDREPEVREALIFDGGHPDAEGSVVFGEALVAAIEARLSP